jgi:hypothetical protein
MSMRKPPRRRSILPNSKRVTRSRLGRLRPRRRQLNTSHLLFLKLVSLKNLNLWRIGSTLCLNGLGLRLRDLILCQIDLAKSLKDLILCQIDSGKSQRDLIRCQVALVRSQVYTIQCQDHRHSRRLEASSDLSRAHHLKTIGPPLNSTGP